MSSLEHEATNTHPTFEHFGRSWTLPPALRYSHQRTMVRFGGNLGIIEALLDDQQKDALEQIDPTVDELDEFTTAMAKAMGFGDAGNSEPSTTS
jgi:hypothetical protein